MIHISTILAVETLPTVVSLQDLVAVAQDQAVRRLKAVPQGQAAAVLLKVVHQDLVVAVLQDKVAQGQVVAVVLYKVVAQDLSVETLQDKVEVKH